MITEEYSSSPVGRLPNSRFPLLIHRKAVAGGGVTPIRNLFQSNGWYNNWQNHGVYTYGHFHSTTHECLGCAQGWIELLVFGTNGTTVRLETGDVVLMPAGVSHAMTGCSDDNIMVGGYPDGRDWDNIQEAYLTEDAYRATVKRIMMLPIPARDPVTGEPMHQWLNAPSSGEVGMDGIRDSLDAVS